MIETEGDIISNDADIETAAKSLKAMAHPLRLKILCSIGESEYSVQDIVDIVGTSQSNISQHLSIMRDKELLISSKEANKVFYRIADQRTVQLIKMMHGIFCNQN